MLQEVVGLIYVWVEVYLFVVGWIVFDFIYCWVGLVNFIVVVVGWCNVQIMFVIGGFVGVVEDFSGMEVWVVVEEV